MVQTQPCAAHRRATGNDSYIYYIIPHLCKVEKGFCVCVRVRVRVYTERSISESGLSWTASDKKQSTCFLAGILLCNIAVFRTSYF